MLYYSQLPRHPPPTLPMLTHVIQRELFWFYPWLRRMTSVLMAFEKRSHTLQPTALANEVLSKLLTWHGEVSGNSEHSLRMLAITIAKQTLIDHGRRRLTRASHWEQVCRDQRMRTEYPRHVSVQTRLTALVDAMEELESIDPILAEMMRLRFFEGYDHQQTAQMLRLSHRTAARRWAFAKAFLADAIARAESASDPTASLPSPLASQSKSG
jgi:DNA-directed RNA polymerase specialized sigma24 family protein